MTENTESASAELVVSPTVAHPITGEILELATTESDRLAGALQAIRDLEQSQMRTAKSEISIELHRRMDAGAKWTLREGGWEIKGQSPGSVDYNAEQLKAAVDLLVEEGKITREAADNAVAFEDPPPLKVSKRGVNALKALGGDVAALVEACEYERDPRSRSVSLTPPAAYYREP